MSRRLIAVVTAVAAIVAPGLAVAAQPSCFDLWYARNSIYDENGYCFKSSLGKEMFDNSDCWTSSPKFSKAEWAAIMEIKDEEDARNCHVN